MAKELANIDLHTEKTGLHRQTTANGKDYTGLHTQRLPRKIGKSIGNRNSNPSCSEGLAL